jgi:hypothetical protein
MARTCPIYQISARPSSSAVAVSRQTARVKDSLFFSPRRLAAQQQNSPLRADMDSMTSWRTSEPLKASLWWDAAKLEAPAADLSEG